MSLGLIGGAYVFIYLSIKVEIYMTDTQNFHGSETLVNMFQFTFVNQPWCNGCRSMTTDHLQIALSELPKQPLIKMELLTKN